MGHKIHGGNIWNHPLAKRKQWLDFSANINPLGLPAGVRDIILKTLDLLVCYPMPYAEQLKKRLASIHGITMDNVLVGNGSIELIYLIMQSLVIKKLLIVTPTFSEYETAAAANNIQCVFLKSTKHNEFIVPMAKLRAKVPYVDCIFLCNPNNPTGVLYSRKELLGIADICKQHKVYLIIDEAFLDFVLDGDLQSMIFQAKNNKYLFVLRSLTKIYALAGLRLGYLIGHTRSIGKIALKQYPWSVNVLAQKAGETVIKDQEYIQKSRALIAKERLYLSNQLRQISGLKVFLSAANFILCELDNILRDNADTLAEKISKHKILIRNCQNFRGLNNRFFRIAVRTHKENKRLVEALKKEIE